VDETLTDTTLSQARKDKITIYLAAHLVFITESQGLVSAAKTQFQEVYRLASDKGFASPYGKTAMQLDTSGKLAEIAQGGSHLRALFSVIQQRQWRQDRVLNW